MNAVLTEAYLNFYYYAAVLIALAVGAGILLTGRSRAARSGGAIFAGLIIFLVPWLLVFSVLRSWEMTVGTPAKSGEVDWGLACRVWEFGYISVETLAVILMAIVLRNAARDRPPLGSRQAQSPTGDPAA